MMLENVEEFKTWGPLLDEELRPDPERAGETFEAFVGMLSTGIRRITQHWLRFVNFLPLKAAASRRNS
jgi:hypothetical protein